MRIERNDVSAGKLGALRFRTVFKIALTALFVCLFSALGFGCAEPEQPPSENVPTDVDVVIPAPPQTVEHSVAFVVDGNTYARSSVRHGELVRPPAPPTKEPSAEFSFTFIGWFLDDVPFDFSSAITSDLSLSARFDSVKNKYPVLFYVDGVLYSSSLIPYGEHALAPPAPTKPDTVEAFFTFIGWSDGNDIFDFSSAITSDKALTALFSIEPKSFSVSFFVDGVLYSASLVPFGEHALAPSTPSKPNTSEFSFSFLGWFIDDVPYDFSSPVTSDISLSARFSSVRRSYTVSFFVGDELFVSVNTEYGLPVRPPIPPEPIAVGDSVSVFSHWALGDSEYTFPPVTSDVGLDAVFVSAKLVSSAVPPESSDGPYALSIPNGVRSLDFSLCDPKVLEDLVALFLPASLDSLTSFDLFGCLSLRAITVDPLNTTFYSVGNCVIDRNSSSLIVGCLGSVIPDGVSSISDYAFSGLDIRYAFIPESVRSVGVGAFSDCLLLSSLFISPGVSSLSDYAVYNCPSLSFLVLPSSLVTVGLFETFPSPVSILFLGSRSLWLDSPLAPFFSEDVVEFRPYFAG